MTTENLYFDSNTLDAKRINDLYRRVFAPNQSPTVNFFDWNCPLDWDNNQFGLFVISAAFQAQANNPDFTEEEQTFIENYLAEGITQQQAIDQGKLPPIEI